MLMLQLKPGFVALMRLSVFPIQNMTGIIALKLLQNECIEYRKVRIEYQKLALKNVYDVNDPRTWKCLTVL